MAMTHSITPVCSGVKSLRLHPELRRILLRRTEWEVRWIGTDFEYIRFNKLLYTDFVYIILLVLSENSMQSEWVKTEIYHARQNEIRDGRRKLFPIGLVEFSNIREWQAFDADTGKDMGREIREYFILFFDFTSDVKYFISIQSLFILQ